MRSRFPVLFLVIGSPAVFIMMLVRFVVPQDRVPREEEDAVYARQIVERWLFAMA